MANSVDHNQLPLVREWHGLAKQLAEIRPKEMQLRKQAAESVFGETRVGTQKAGLPNNLQLSLSVSREIGVDKAAYAKYKAEMEAKGLIGDESVIKLEPKVSMKAYDAMSDEDKVRFADVFKHKTGSPTMKVEQGKVEI